LRDKTALTRSLELLFLTENNDILHLLDGYHINKIYANIKSIEEIYGFYLRNFVPQKKQEKKQMVAFFNTNM
jgi:hypothetical protein